MIKKYKGKLGKFSYDDADFKISKLYGTHGVDYICYIGNETDGSKIKIPKGIKSCYHMFAYNSLETPPEIPEGVKDCSLMFVDCKNLKIAPAIPEGVKNCNGMFWNCYSLETAPAIPEGVEDCRSMFWNCINLKILPEVPETVKNKGDMFTGCKKAFETLLHEMFS